LRTTAKRLGGVLGSAIRAAPNPDDPQYAFASAYLDSVRQRDEAPREMKMSDAKNRVFKDMALDMDELSEHYAQSLLGIKSPTTQFEKESGFVRASRALAAGGLSSEELKGLIYRMLRAQAHSFLVMLDGGTALAEKGRVQLVDEQGQPLGDGLHEAFFDYLDDIGRLDR
jgi:hypothetical protein